MIKFTYLNNQRILEKSLPWYFQTDSDNVLQQKHNELYPVIFDLLRRFGFAVSLDKWLHFARRKNGNILYQHLLGKQITEYFKVRIERVYTDEGLPYRKAIKTCHSKFYNIYPS